jgi:hypothetical protein
LGKISYKPDTGDVANGAAGVRCMTPASGARNSDAVNGLRPVL